MSNREELHEQFFVTPFWSTHIPEWVDEVNKTCQPYLDEAHERQSAPHLFLQHSPSRMLFRCSPRGLSQRHHLVLNLHYS